MAARGRGHRQCDRTVFICTSDRDSSAATDGRLWAAPFEAQTGSGLRKSDSGAWHTHRDPECHLCYREPFVQSGVNSFDAVMVSGNAAAANADTLIFNIMAAFYTGCSSFIGQNWGAGNRERMKKELSRPADLFLCGRCDLWRTSADFFGRQFLSLFATEPAVIDAGMRRVKIMGFSLYDQCVYGLQHRSLPRNWKEHCADGHRYFRLLCVPGDLVYTIFVWILRFRRCTLYFFSWAITSVAEVLYFRHSFRQLEFQS